jgi:hypothetical protein
MRRLGCTGRYDDSCGRLYKGFNNMNRRNQAKMHRKHQTRLQRPNGRIKSNTSPLWMTSPSPPIGGESWRNDDARLAAFNLNGPPVDRL